MNEYTMITLHRLRVQDGIPSTSVPQLNSDFGKLLRFLPHDAYAVARRLSVCPSHAGIELKLLTYHQTFFTVGCHTILVFFRAKLYGNGNISTGCLYR